MGIFKKTVYYIEYFRSATLINHDVFKIRFLMNIVYIKEINRCINDAYSDVFFSIVKLLFYLLRLFWVFCIKSIEIMHKTLLSLQTKYIKSTCLTNKTQTLKMHLSKKIQKDFQTYMVILIPENNKMSTFTKLNTSTLSKNIFF